MGKNEVGIGEAGSLTELMNLDTNKSRGKDSLLPLLFKERGVNWTSLKNQLNNIKRLRKFSID